MPDLSKHVWKFQEGLICVLLERSGIPSAHIHWGETPTGLSVDTDIVIGRDVERPSATVMVTHNTADNAGGMKFWRTVNELFEFRSAYPRATSVNVLFESGVPPVTMAAMMQLFDSTLVLGESARLKPLVAIAETFTEQHLFQADREDALEALRDWTRTCPTSLRTAVLALQRWLSSAVRRRAATPAWASVLAPCRPLQNDFVAPTSVRRSLGKLVILPDADFEALLSGRRLPAPPNHFPALGLSAPSLGGHLVSPEIRQAVSGLGRPTVEAVRARAREELAVLPRLEGQALGLSNIPRQIQWMRSHWRELTSARSLSRLLAQCYVEPGRVGPRVETDPTWHWLFDLIVYAIKQARGSRHGFSYSKLADALGHEGVIGRNARLQFAYYAERKRDLPSGLLTTASRYLASTLEEEIDPTQLDSVGSQVAAMRADGVVERVMNAQEFEPLYWALEAACGELGLGYRVDKAVLSFISDLHPMRPGTTKLAFVGGTDIASCRLAVHCRTAHDGAIDKRKELCARGRSLRYRLAPALARSRLDGRLALVLDGDWSATDCDLLARSGWSFVLGPFDLRSALGRLQ